MNKPHFIPKSKHLLIALTGVLLLTFVFSSSQAVLADTLGQKTVFNVNSSYDRFARESVSATLQHVGTNAYFYVEDAYYDALSPQAKSNFISQVQSLANEFDSIIYPKITGFFGSEPNPGVDNDPHITVLLENLKSGTGGYYETVNQYSKNNDPDSNEREMITISSSAVLSGNASVFITHELQHLISFNQKELRNNVNEEVWLNELRSQYAITVAGYNTSPINSDLENRENLFISNSTDSLTEWPNTFPDYAIATIFGHYLVDQYGPDILKSSLTSSLVSIDSIDQFLISGGYQERFTDVFGSWAIASYLNDRTKNPKYGYANDILKDLRVPLTRSDLLPAVGRIELVESLKPWQANWYRYQVNPNQNSQESISLDMSLSASGFSFFYFDNLSRAGKLTKAQTVIDNPGGLEWFVLIPVNASKKSGFGQSDSPLTMRYALSYVPRTSGTLFVNDTSPAIPEGSLIKKPGQKELYVVTGKYKRYLSPEVVALYGHLDPSKAIEVSPAVFDSYTTSNYIRYVIDKKVYAVWPDNTKHWLNMSAELFTQSGRDWNSIFIISEREYNFYKTGEDIKR